MIKHKSIVIIIIIFVIFGIIINFYIWNRFTTRLYIATENSKNLIKTNQTITKNIKEITKQSEEQQIKLQKLQNLLSVISENTGSGEHIALTVKDIKESVISIIATQELVVIKRDPYNSYNPYQSYDYLEPRRYKYEEKEVDMGGGSGFIYSDDGYILTNKHVVFDQKLDYTVVLYDGTELPAKIVALDPYNDVAMVKVVVPKDKKLKPVILGDSDKMQVGQRIIAIGNALSQFKNTVTTGIISARERSIMTSGSSGNQEEIENLLQTDAAINPGNSGGPLLNINGEVIGMNTAIANDAAGIGFAIPGNDLRNFARVVKKYGSFKPPYLGIRYFFISDEMAQKSNGKATQGIWVTSFNSLRRLSAVEKGSPADIAGIKENDIIVEIDSQKIVTKNTIRDIIIEKDLDGKQEISVKIWRNGKTKNLILKMKRSK